MTNICLRRSSVSFANENSYDSTGSNKICGSSSSLVIIPTSEPCPYVNVSYSNFELENNTLVINDPESLLPALNALFNSTSPFSFYTYPIIKFKVSEFEFCLMDEDSGLDLDHSDFILLSETRGCL